MASNYNDSDNDNDIHKLLPLDSLVTITFYLPNGCNMFEGNGVGWKHGQFPEVLIRLKEEYRSFFIGNPKVISCQHRPALSIGEPFVKLKEPVVNLNDKK